MSISSRQNEVARHQKSLADLQKKLTDESKKEVSKTDEINRIIYKGQTAVFYSTRFGKRGLSHIVARC